MRNRRRIVWVLGALAVAATAGGAKAKSATMDDAGGIVMVLKNGQQRQQRGFKAVGVERIEFSAAAGTAVVRGRARFLGEWTVGDGAGGTFTITLKSDGSANKTIGSSSGGTWTVVNGEARITWDDGWHDAIRRVGDKYQKAAYAPGHTFSDQPDNVADARKHPEPN